MSLNKNRVKKLEERNIQSDKQDSLIVWTEGIVAYKGKEYKKEEFENLYPDIKLIIVVFE